ARDSGWHGHAVHVIRVFGVLAADVHLAGGRAHGAGDGLLDDLGRRVGGGTVIFVLFEELVAGPGIDRDGCAVAGYRDGPQSQRGRGKGEGARGGPGPRRDLERYEGGLVADVVNPDLVGPLGQMVEDVAAELVAR